MSKPRADQYLAVFLLSLIFLVTMVTQVPVETAATLPEILTPAPMPVLANISQPEEFMASLSAQAMVAIDVPSAAILLAKNEQQKLSPASTTKMMTALVVRDTFDLDDIITVKQQPTNIGHTLGFIPGEQFRVEDMLQALLISSSNDAAEVLAQNHPQGHGSFIAAMNQKAQALHLENTTFINPSGLDAAAHYTTAFDLSLVSREVMQDSVLREIVATKQASTTDLTQQNQYHFYNTNLLLGVESGVVGIKTGTTDLAGEALVTQLERDGRTVLIVVMGSQDRYTDTKQIINWLFSHYQWELI